RVDHLQDGGRWCKVRAAATKQIHDLSSAIAGTLHDLLNTLGRKQLRDGDTCYGAHTGKRNHRIPMTTQYVSLHIAHRYLQFLSDKRAETGSIQDIGHTNHASARETASAIG